MKALRGMVAICCLLVIVLPVRAQDRLLTLDDIYDPEKRVEFSGTPATGLRWMNDGKHYLQRRSEGRTRTGVWLKVEAESGTSSPLYDVSKMEAALTALPGIGADEARRIANRGHTLNPLQNAVLINHMNDLFYYEFGSDRAVRLTHDPDEEVGEEFSPDGRLVSFVRNNNVFVVDLATQRERALTSDGSPTLLNGRLDWVYQEELYGRGNFKGYWWSPDSARIVYLQLDESPVKEFTVIDHIPRLQTVEVTNYPKAGDPNPNVRVGVVGAAGGRSTWLDTFKYEGIDFLVVRVDWSPDSRRVVFQVQNREQSWLDLNFADPVSGKTETAFRETSPAWVEVNDNPYWLKDGSFLWPSERTGWHHLYHYSSDGKLIRQVTSGEWVVRNFHGVDEAAGQVYFSGTKDSHIAVNAYRIRLDGTGLTRLTQSEGNHAVNFSPTFSYFIDNWSDINTPVQVRLHGADGSLVRIIDENKVSVLSEYKLGKPEFLKVKTRDGFEMEAIMIKPPDFDPSRKYPVWSYTYSGPQAPMVRNSWGGPTYMWHQMLAQKGYIIWICDNRTASGKGINFAWPLYRNFGELELRDLEDGLAWLKSQPYVDGDRIGLWGWSFGGYMTLYAMTRSKSFKIGIAGGSVTDWRLYDTIYTERYMGTPQNNPEGYKKSAPLNYVRDFHGKVLLIHGMMDDNVHMQQTVQFAYELQRAGRQFELMLYPRSRHGVVDPALVKHMRTAMTEFILKNL